MKINIIKTFFADPTLANHTIYQPKSIPPVVKMPVLVWANGGCIAVGTIMMPFLVQVASQGIIVIANGAPGNVTGSYESFGSAPRSTSKYLTAAVDWAVQNAGKGKYAHMDASRVAAAGQSCGGLEAYDMVKDTRVSTIGIFNSGGALMGNSTTNTNTTVKSITKPIFYYLGGSTDIAYASGEADYAMLPATTPTWKGNLPVGHGGTYNEVNGGKIGVAASYMYDWILRGNTTASSFYTTDVAAKAAGWDVVSRNLDKIKVSPL
ncbi:hypothetical protein BGZ60DRAFT_444675 [Tricladium varicosporioides]|nr:hypothetical protein BGZ60DRAFT_444675 [Hymenoscyphus varicosporioides]